MISKIKEYFWVILFSAIILGATILFKDMDQVEELKSVLRRKRVEDDVNEIKRKLSDQKYSVTNNEDELVELAEKMREENKKVKKATPEEIKEFYDGFFKS